MGMDERSRMTQMLTVNIPWLLAQELDVFFLFWKGSGRGRGGGRVWYTQESDEEETVLPPSPPCSLSLYLTKEAVKGGTVKQDLALETSYLFSVHLSPSLTLKYSPTEMLYWEKKKKKSGFGVKDI